MSSFSIMYIRAFLVESGKENMIDDARLISQTLNQLDSVEHFEKDEEENEFGIAGRYSLLIYDQDGTRIYASEDNQPDSNLPGYVMRYYDQHDADNFMLDDQRDDSHITVYGKIEAGLAPDGWFSISKDEELLYEPVATMRWIIYTGMFISIGVILIVSALAARGISQPIVQLSSDAGRIASGEVSHSIKLNRKDEFGELANSINQLAEHLKADNERLQKINERQRQFFADIAHEIRNPLHTMMGSLEMLEIDKLDDDTRKKYVANARGQAERLNQLFKDIMTLQRYDSDRDFIELSTFDLSKLVAKSCNWYRYIAEDKNIKLHHDEDFCEVKADKAKIEQVLDNLLSNALKFSNEGTVEVKYHQQNSEVMVEVKDTGIGIPEEHQDRLFDRFYRTDKARSRDKGGTGLGLAVVKSILESHDKQIYLDSTPGEGSRFYFHLDKA